MYSRDVDGKTLTFGISGRLYKSNVLLYDHQSDSLWSQLKSQAIAGPQVGKTLRKLPSTRTSWGAWRTRYPDGLVLSERTGYARDYSVDPYEGYYRIGSLMFPVGDVRTDLPAKERVLGISVGDRAVAFPLEAITRTPGILKHRLGEQELQIHISDAHDVSGVYDAGGRPLAPVFAYWFAWQAFHPDTRVYKGP